MDLEAVCKLLPKIELHAHLNGSLSEDTLKKLGCLGKNVEQYQLSQLFNNTEKTLEECFKVFSIAQKATRNKNSLHFATQSVIKDFYDDNVIYLEIRTTPRNEESMSKIDYIESVVKGIQDNPYDIMVKLLLSIDRRLSSEESEDSMMAIIQMKMKYPEIIKGVDLSGDPKVGHFNHKLFKQAADNGLAITIHCAEVENNEEVRSILEFSPQRLGHSTCLHPNYGGNAENWQLYLEKKIPNECCLSSNVLCGTSSSYENHHLQEWIKYNLPFTLGTDDKGVFCTTLSREYLLAAKAFSLTHLDLWDISYNSIDFIFGTSEEKKILKTKLDEWKLKNLI